MIISNVTGTRAKIDQVNAVTNCDTMNKAIAQLFCNLSNQLFWHQWSQGKKKTVKYLWTYI